MIHPSALTKLPGLLTSFFHCLLPIADLMPAVQKATCAFREKQFYKLTLIKASNFGKTHKRTLKLLNENQHLHGNYAERKLSAVVASPHLQGMYNTQNSIFALLQTASIPISKLMKNQTTR